MFKIKHSYEEFKQNEQECIELLAEDQTLRPPAIALVGVYASSAFSTLPIIIGRTINGKEVPENYGGPIDGNAIEFHILGFPGRRYCADSEEAYNAFLEKINDEELDNWRNDTNV